MTCPNCNRMHRRAQEAESKAAKAWRQNDIERLWKTVALLKSRADFAEIRAYHWKKLYYESKANRPLFARVKDTWKRWALWKKRQGT